MKDRSPFANVLHVETIAKLARGAILTRGRAYADQGRVTRLARRKARLSATVQGTAMYAVSIWVKGRGLGYACSCPAGAQGDFCKHCVAVAVVWVARHV
jgi:uncharacterized Zn finger protein